MDSSHLKGVLDWLLIPNVRIDHREISHIHRELNGKQIFFFASNSEKKLAAALEMKARGRVERWDLETGKYSISLHRDHRRWLR